MEETPNEYLFAITKTSHPNFPLHFAKKIKAMKAKIETALSEDTPQSVLEKWMTEIARGDIYAEVERRVKAAPDGEVVIMTHDEAIESMMTSVKRLDPTAVVVAEQKAPKRQKIEDEAPVITITKKVEPGEEASNLQEQLSSVRLQLREGIIASSQGRVGVTPTEYLSAVDMIIEDIMSEVSKRALDAKNGEGVLMTKGDMVKVMDATLAEHMRKSKAPLIGSAVAEMVDATSKIASRYPYSLEYSVKSSPRSKTLTVTLEEI